ncbi:unnamed protein product, partial [Mesorhabditis spiculigera]
MVESREGVRICTGYPHKQLYHCLEKWITPGEVVPGYPRSCETWALNPQTYPLRRYRMKNAAYTLGFLRLLQKIHSTAEFSIDGDTTGVWPIDDTPFQHWRLCRQRAAPRGWQYNDALRDAIQLRWYAKSRSIEIYPVLRAIRWMGKFWCNYPYETRTPRIVRMIGGRPEVFQVTRASLLGPTTRSVTELTMIADRICRDSFEPWPTRAFIWESYVIEESMPAVLELLPRSPSLPPGILITHLGAFEEMPDDPVRLVTDMLLDEGLEPLPSDWPSTIAFRDAFDRYVAEEFGTDKGTWFFQWPNSEKEVLLQLRYHEAFPQYAQKFQPHVTITIMVVPSC